MEFPIHDNIGEVTPALRQEHFAKSATPEEFIEYAKEKTLEELQFEEGFAAPLTLLPERIELWNGIGVGPIVYEQGKGPREPNRYVQDPTDPSQESTDPTKPPKPGGVIDMRHFLASAQIPHGLGEPLGILKEFEQGMSPNKGGGNFISAYEREDYKSNFLGAVFRNHYYRPEEGELSGQLQKFFTDLENGELKGVVPTFEYFLSDVIDLPKDGQRALQQLENIIEHERDSRLRDLYEDFKRFVDPPAYARDAEGGFNQATAQGRQPIDPLVLDLDGDGIELTSVDNHLVRFDIDGDGFREATGWVQSDDGLLVLDRNSDGYINDISELFGNQTTSGFVHLRAIDDNADGFIDTADAKFSHLQVWRDLDFDGRSDGNELFTLDELGISRIRTAASSTNITNAGNQIAETSSFELTDGTQREIANVGFSVDQLNSYYDPNSTFSAPVVFTAEILNLPNLRGYGNLPDLQVAMAQDEQILALVRSLTEETSGDVSSAGERIRSILFRWAGVDGIAPTSRGSNVNAQELGFIEKFVGRSYPPNLTVTAAAGQTLSQTFAHLEGTLVARLLAQVTEVPVEYDASSDRLVFNGSVTEAQTQFEQSLAQSTTSGLEQLVLAEFLRQQGAIDASWSVGSLNPDRLVGSSGSEHLLGFSGNDTLEGNAGDDTIDGGAGNDNLSGGDGQDTLRGGDGSDTLSGGNGDDSLNGGAGDDALDGSHGNDTLNGGAGNDTLNGVSGNDTYRFERGNGTDVIFDNYGYWWWGYNTLDGGNDTLSFGQDISRNDLSWNFDGVDLTFTVAGNPTPDTLKIQNQVNPNHRIENITVAGTPLSLEEIMTARVNQDDTNRNSLSWDATAIAFDGGAGDDTITTGSYADKLYGGSGNDTINSGAGDDTLDGGAGNDTLEGNAGNDVLEGGAGDDNLSGSDGQDTLSGGAGNDTLNGVSGNDTYRFERGNGTDVIFDNYGYWWWGYNTLDGGNDTLSFGQDISRNDLSWNFDGVDLTFTVAGNPTPDTLKIQNQVNPNHRIENITVAGTPLSLEEIMTARVNQDDTNRNSLSWDATAIAFDGGAGDDTITTGSYADKLYGGSGNDTINSGASDDTLDGGAGSDTLIGGSGNDILVGGFGNDTLTGGEGADQFVYDTNATFTNSAVELDLITDFARGSDKLVLDKTTFTALASIAGSGFSVESEFAVVASDAAAATTGALIAYSSATGNLFYNSDGTADGLGSGGQFATLTGIPGLTAADFQIQA